MASSVLQSHPAIALTMVDLDPVMVRSADRRVDEFGPRATVQVADATCLPFGPATFDTVLSFIMLHHVIDWRKALAEAARTLRPGGQLLGYDLTRTRVTTAFHRIDRSAVAMLSPDELRQGLHHASLDVRSESGLARCHRRLKSEVERAGSGAGTPRGVPEIDHVTRPGRIGG